VAYPLKRPREKIDVPRNKGDRKDGVADEAAGAHRAGWGKPADIRRGREVAGGKGK